MENILQGIIHAYIYLDDILITGSAQEENLQNLGKVLTRLKNAGICLKCYKCIFLLSAMEYLGHNISSQGLQSTDEKFRQCKRLQPQKTWHTSNHFLGCLTALVSFCLIFLTHWLLTTDYHKRKCMVLEARTKSYIPNCKGIATSDCPLAHFDPAGKKLILACDPPPYGVGVVLFHQMDNGKGKLIVFHHKA